MVRLSIFRAVPIAWSLHRRLLILSMNRKSRIKLPKRAKKKQTKKSRIQSRINPKS